jgi:hypothetical protein
LIGIPFDMNDDVFLYSYDDNNSNLVHIWEVYKIDSFGELIILNHGNWSDLEGLLTFTNEKKWKSRCWKRSASKFSCVFFHLHLLKNVSLGTQF